METCIEKATELFTAAGNHISQIRSVGITNQRETLVLWDKHTGEPLHNAVVWPDTRTASLVRELKNWDGADKLQDLCGLPLSTYPSSVKLVWLLRHVEPVKKAYEEGRLVFGTVDSWLIFKLNGGMERKEGPLHVTDSTNASRTMFMNIHKLEYDDTLLNFFKLDRSKITLPKIIPSSHATAYGNLTRGPLKGVPIAGCLGDQSAALVGQCGFKPGQAKNTYGTGCFLLYNCGTEPVISKNGLLATVAYDFGQGQKPVYALEGSIAVGGSGITFLQNNLGIVQSSKEVDKVANTVSDNGGVYFVTAFSGLFAPYWIDDAKGTMCKSPASLHIRAFPLTRNNSRHHRPHPKGPHHPRDPRSNLPPDRRHPRRHGHRLRPPARGARRRRRPLQQRPVHADPGRRVGHPRRQARHARNDGAGRRRGCGPRDGRVGELGGSARGQQGRADRLRAQDWGTGAEEGEGQVGAGCQHEQGLDKRGSGRRECIDYIIDLDGVSKLVYTHF